MRLLFCIAVLLALLLAPTGCSSHHHRKVRVIEEQHEGEVHEAPQGEMIVE
jgi:hypothetical protein